MHEDQRDLRQLRHAWYGTVAAWRSQERGHGGREIDPRYTEGTW